jgi:hypothetical protein
MMRITLRQLNPILLSISSLFKPCQEAFSTGDREATLLIRLVTLKARHRPRCFFQHCTTISDEYRFVELALWIHIVKVSDSYESTDFRIYAIMIEAV